MGSRGYGSTRALVVSGLVVGAISLLAFLARVVPGPFPIDDAYITFRYARNVALGRGLVYNPGENVLGTTSPLFALLLGGAAAIAGPEGIPKYALFVNALADGINVLVFLWMLRRLGVGWVLRTIGGLLLALSPLGIRYAVGGMESSLATLLALAITGFTLLEWEGSAGLMSGLAYLIRPDLLAATASAGLAVRWEKGRVPWRLLIPAALIIGGAALLVLWGYGEPVPNSVLAKMSRIYQPSPWLNSIQLLYGFVALFSGNFIVPHVKGIVFAANPVRTVLALVAALPFMLLWVRGAVLAIRRGRRWLAIVFYPILVVVIYSLAGIRGDVIAEWYLAPLTPFLLAPVLLGIDKSVSHLGPRGGLFASSAMGLALLAICLKGLNLGQDPDRPLLLPLSVDTERETLYRNLMLEMRGEIGPTDLVAAPEIGALGYYCDCRVLDTVGLVSPRALSYYPLPIKVGDILNAVPGELIRDARPEWVISLEAFLRPTLLQDQWFLGHYVLVDMIPTNVFGSNGLLVFRR